MKLAKLSSIGLSIVAAAAFATQSAAGAASQDSGPAKSCCARTSGGEHDGHEQHGQQKMRCSLTGKVVDTCCCVEREGKTHCTLADKDVAECCCTPVGDDASAEADKSASAKAN